MKIVITGAAGLIGWHAGARLHAQNCAARFKGNAEPFEIIALNRNDFQDDDLRSNALKDAKIVLHFAGINRDTPEAQEHGNIALAQQLADAVTAHAPQATLCYTNSIQQSNDTPYGRGKRGAADILRQRAQDHQAAFIDLILPHIFGEGGRPFYNNVTGTLCHQIVHGETPQINPEGAVELVHAGAAAQAAIDAALQGKSRQIRLEGTKISIQALYDQLLAGHDAYQNFRFPKLENAFEIALFNTYRQHLYPDHFPRTLQVHADARGRLFECAKSESSGQSFISWTEPEITRGEHFHLHKVERFLVVEGRARIAMRRVLSDETHVFEVDGDTPAYVDMPTLWTHNITNIGTKPLVTMFWTNDLFDPNNPDTYADPVGA